MQNPNINGKNKFRIRGEKFNLLYVVTCIYCFLECSYLLYQVFYVHWQSWHHFQIHGQYEKTVLRYLERGKWYLLETDRQTKHKNNINITDVARHLHEGEETTKTIAQKY